MSTLTILIIITIVVIITVLYIIREKKTVQKHKMAFLALKLLKDNSNWKTSKSDLKIFLKLFYGVTMELNENKNSSLWKSGNKLKTIHKENNIKKIFNI